MEQVERRVLADRNGLIARGQVENLPTFGVEQAAFDAWLFSEPEQVAAMSVEQIELLEERRALGVA